MAATERIDIVVRENGSRVVRRNLQDVGQSGEQAARGVNLLKTALAGLGIGLTVSELVRLADSYTTILNRLRLVTTSTQNLAAVNDALFASANRTYSSYEATAELYGSLARSAQGLGLSQQQLLNITESINQAIAISGTEASTAANGLRQLGQGLASGTLRGDELNSVLENMPRLASAIASGMGVTVGQLRALGAQGKITAKQITDAIQSQGPKLAEEFATINPTIANTFTVLMNNVTRFVGELNQASGFGRAFGQVILLVANNLDAVAAAAGTVLAAFAWSRAVAAVTSVLGPMIALERALGATSGTAALYSIAVKAAQGATRGLTAALLANPFTALIAAVGLAVTAIIAFGDQVAVTSDGAVTLKDAFFATLSLIWDMVKTVTAAFMEAWDAAYAATSALLSSFGVSWSDVFSTIWQFTKTVINAVISYFVFAYTTIKAAWNNFPGYLDLIFTTVANLAAAAAEKVINSWQLAFRGIAGLLSYVNQDAADGLNGALDALTINLPRAQLSAAGKQMGQSVKEGFQSAFGTDYLGEAGAAIINRARSMGGGGAGDVSTDGGVATATPGSGKTKKTRGETRPEYLAGITREAQDAIAQSRILDNQLRAVQEQVDKVNEHLADKHWALLDPAEEKKLRDLVTLREREAKLAEERDRILNAARGPQEDYERHLTASKQLLDAGLISLDKYTEGLRNARIEYLRTKTDAASGLELGKLTVQQGQDNAAGRLSSAYQSEWAGANSAMQELQDKATALQQLMQDDPVHSGVYAQRLREVGVAALELKGNLPDATVFDSIRGGLARFVNDFHGMMPGLTQAWGQWLQRIGDGAAEAFGRAIVYGDNLGDALRNVAQSAMAELLGSLIKLGIQWLIMQVIGQSSMAAIGATGAAMGATTAAAWAPAAAAVSLATFGANSVPAMAGIASTFALTTALSAAGLAGFDKGGYTGDVGVADVAGVVHGKEFVVNADATKRWRGLLEAINSGQTPGYRTGGYVAKGGSSSYSAMSLGSSGAVDAGGRAGVGDTISISIDARGAQDGVEDKINQALDAALPEFLAKSRKQEETVRKMREGRQKIGGGSR